MPTVEGTVSIGLPSGDVKIAIEAMAQSKVHMDFRYKNMFNMLDLSILRSLSSF